METDIFKKIEKRFQWLVLNNNRILYVNLKDATENEYIVCTQQLRTVVANAPFDDIRVIVDMTGVKFSPRMIYYSMQTAKFGNKKVTRKAGIGLGPVVLALFRITRMRSPNTRLFNNYTEAIEYMSQT